MSVRQLKSGKWNAQLRVSGYPHKSKTFPLEELASEWLEAEKERCVSSRPFDTFPEMGEMYARIALNGRPTEEEVSQRVGRIGAQLKTLNIPLIVNDITSEHINDFRIHRLSKVCSATVRKDLLLISRVYKWAANHFKIELANPAVGIMLPADSKPRNRVIERHELEQITSRLKPTMACIVELAYETAMRRSEICKIRLKDLNLEKRYLSVIDGKTGDRLVPLTKRAVQVLKKASEACVTNESRLFPVAPHSVSTAFRRARKLVGLDTDVRLHQLRHTRITQVARKGFNQAQIMMVSGHVDTRSVQRYTHLNVSDVIDLID